VYTLDTNAIIYYLDEDAAVVPVLEPILAQDIAIFVSVVTELELLSHPGLTEEDIAEIAQVLTSMVVFPLESRLAQLAGTLRRQYRLKTPDSIVAATALLTRTTLVTRNIRDFQEIAALSLLPI
jgi:predicted nucleic acid-binding protein